MAQPDPPGSLQQGPYVVLCEPGRYAYCMCRESARFPYCDGTHRGSATSPIKVVFEVAQQVAWCACGRSGNKPFCDGSHRAC